MKLISYLLGSKGAQAQTSAAIEVINPDELNLQEVRAAFSAGKFTQLVDLLSTSNPSPEINFYLAVMIENNLIEEAPYIDEIKHILDNSSNKEDDIEKVIKKIIGGREKDSIMRELHNHIQALSPEGIEDDDKEIFIDKLKKLVNKEAAISLYKKSYDGGFLQAGNSLAKLYQKQGKTKEAEIIYHEIVLSEHDGKEAKAYASYQLARMSEKKILHQAGQDVTATQRAIENYNAIDKAGDQVSNSMHKKILYHTALLKLEVYENKKAEAEAQTAKIMAHYNDELKKVESDSSEFKEKHKEVLEDYLKFELAKIDKANGMGELNEAKKLLKESSDLDYNPAKAELANIEARELLLQGKYLEAIGISSQDSLRYDAKNINARLISAASYEAQADIKWNDEKYDAALDLAKDVLRQDPENKVALDQKIRLTEKLVTEVSKRIVESLLEKTKEFIPEYSYFSGPTQPQIDKMNEAREEYINTLYDKVRTSLIEEEYIKDHSSFAKIEKTVIELTEIIYYDNHSNFEKIIKNRKEEDKAEAVKRIDRGITRYCNLQSKDQKADISRDDQALIDNRKVFKEQILEQLMEYHKECSALTSKTSKLQVQLNTAGFDYAAQLAAPLAGFLGPNAGGVAVGFAGLGLKVIKDFAEKRYRQGLYDTAKRFASIGEEDNKRTTSHSNNAREAFEYVAEELVRSYGAQIDNVQGEIAINALATTATEKMLNHLSNNTSTMKKARQFVQSPFASIISGIRSNLSNVKQETRDYISEMLEGVIKGKSTKAEEKITTKDGMPWIADEVFEKPAITIDGENIYCNNKSDAITYGARYSEFVPNDYNKTEVESSAKHRIEQRLQKHLYILEKSDTRLKEDKHKYQEKREEITQTQYAKDRRKARVSFVAGLTEIAFGAASAYTAGLYGLTVGLGFHPAIITIAATTFGISAAIVTPIAITTFAVIGVGLLIKGAIDTVKATDKLDLLDKKKIISVEEANSRMAKKAHIKDMKKAKDIEKISAKVIKKARYVVGRDKIEHVQKTHIEKVVLKAAAHWKGLTESRR